MAVVLDQPTFIAAFPEFANEAVYTPAAFAFWESNAELQLNPARFGASLQLAVCLFVAHNLSLAAEAAQVVATGGIAGNSLAAVASKTVGSVSVSYDTSDSSIPGAGEWNSTGYGQRLYRMLKSFNTGPFYAAHPRPLPRFGRLGYGRPY